ncbi:hypothetical protein GW17_00054487 [Ensete ventricosum]|nr:hypothetical protein GW17_00054487 [Ensete ventricosum]RZR83858.1 hypothetical protein BHM03_00010576 [Ensete ventricosum]
MKTHPKERDQRRYYCFHRNYDHDVKEGYDLKNQIEYLSHREHLDRYMRKSHKPSPQPKGPDKKQIDVIVDISTLLVTAGEEPKSKILMVSLMVVRLPSAYNAILDCPTVNKLRATVSIYHRIMKFLSNAGVREAKSDLRESRQCYLMTMTLPKNIKHETSITDPWEPSKATP